MLLDEEKAIVSAIPGTTRDLVEGSLNVGNITLAEGEARIGLALTNEKVDTVSYSKEYGKEGMLLTDEYQEFKATIKAASGFSSTGTQALVFGFPAGTKTGIAAEFGWNSPDAAYIAEEVAYDITNTKISGPDKLTEGSTAEFKAEVLNQCEHSYSAWKNIGEVGHSRTCSKCNITYTQSHQWDEGEIKEKPGDALHNLKIFTCAVCSGTKEQEIFYMLNGPLVGEGYKGGTIIVKSEKRVELSKDDVAAINAALNG